MSVEIICPDGCDTALPAVEFSLCAPKLLDGQIQKLYIGNVGNPFADWADGAEWADRIDNTDTVDATKIRELDVIGSIGKPDFSSKVISLNRTVTGNKTFTINGRIDDNSEANYDAARTFQCGLTNSLWFQTSSGKLYGGNEGIEGNLNIWEEIPESLDDFAILVFEFIYKKKIMPMRIDSPIAA